MIKHEKRLFLALLASLGVCLGLVIGLSYILGTKEGLENGTRGIILANLISFSVMALLIGIKVTRHFLMTEEVVEFKTNR